ncbi:MAG: hypothetical protein ACRC06_11930 [Waterburya sp.]
MWQLPDWQHWLEVGCERIRLHPILVAEEIDSAIDVVKTCMKHGQWLNPEKAEFLVKQGLTLAKDKEKVNLDEVTNKLKQAEKLNSANVDLPELTKKAQAIILIEQGKSSAENANLKQAKIKFKQAKEIDSANVDLLELTKEANQLAANILIEQGNSQTEQGNIIKALSLYDQAQKLNPDQEIDSESWDSLCWNGSIYNYAQKVLFACEKALKLATDEKAKPQYKYTYLAYLDSRGLARALTGNTKGAIADFQAYVDYSEFNEEYLNQRKQWIKYLKQGENPFTDEVLEDLKNQ